MEYKDLSLTCNHCGKPLESKPDHSHSFILSGSYPMEHRHMHNKSKKCVIILEGVAAPYDNWSEHHYHRYYDDVYNAK